MREAILKAADQIYNSLSSLVSNISLDQVVIGDRAINLGMIHNSK